MKKILFTVAAAALLGLAACGGTTEPSSVVPSEEPISQDSATPSEDSTSHETPVSSEEDSPYEKITVAEIIAWCNEQDPAEDTKDTDTVFEVTGIIEGLKEGDKYGNGFLTDGDSTIVIYGSTTDETAISGDPGTYTFKNPQKGVTGIANGEEVTMHVLRENYKGKPEIMGVYVDHKTSTNTYAATVTPFENGTAVVDKEAYTYGETVTVTVTPSEGYQTKEVVVTNLQGQDFKAKVSESDINVYTFPAVSKNVITVTLEAAGTVKNYYELDKSDTGWPTAYSEEKAEPKTSVGSDFTVGGVQIHGVNVAVYSGGSIQINGEDTKNPGRVKGFFGNKVALEKKITSIVVTATKEKYTKHAPGDLVITSGTSAMTSFSTAAAIAPTKDEEGGYTYTYTPTGADDVYFNISHNSTDTYAVYLDSVIINFAA